MSRPLRMGLDRAEVSRQIVDGRFRICGAIGAPRNIISLTVFFHPTGPSRSKVIVLRHDIVQPVATISLPSPGGKVLLAPPGEAPNR